MSQFKTIGILGRVKSEGVTETVKSLINYLRDLKLNIILDTETAEAIGGDAVPQLPRVDFGKRCNLVIVVGGDGSILNAARTVVNDEIPVIGINRGRLGFLTDIKPHQMDKIKDILEGKFILEKRFLLTATVELDGNLLGQCDALNEIALTPDAPPHMTSFEVYIDNKFVCSQDSDGVIIATPTGSTAYALSGGGPILHPQLDAIVMVPMFPHSLNMRPIVLEGNQHIMLVISGHNKITPRVTADSQEWVNAPPGSQIHIHKKAQRLHLIHPIDYDYYENLRSKLHWGHKLYP